MQYRLDRQPIFRGPQPASCHRVHKAIEMIAESKKTTAINVDHVVDYVRSCGRRTSASAVEVGPAARRTQPGSLFWTQAV
jgi:hypothetical protein